MSFFKPDKLTSINACLAPSVALLCEYSNRDPLLEYFLINSESN